MKEKVMYCPCCQKRTIFTDTNIFGFECSICKGQNFIDEDKINKENE